jgi:O-antigen biosynthesis protein WbqP
MIFSRTIALIIFLFLFPLLLLLTLIILIFDGTPVIYQQTRIGKGNIKFQLYKFRTMGRNTPDIATHLLATEESIYTRFGKVFRKYSLDELPQLFNIIKGDLSFIGPRPALHNQYDLIKMRTMLGIPNIYPGITGWAQVNGRDTISIAKKVELDKYYLNNRGLYINVKIIFLSFRKVLFGMDVEV